MTHSPNPNVTADERWNAVHRVLGKKSVGRRELELAVGELTSVSEAARDAGQTELWRAAQLLEQLLEVALVEQSQGQSASPRGSQFIAFVREHFPTLTRAAQGDAAAQEALDAAVVAARAEWSEYLDCAGLAAPENPSPEASWDALWDPNVADPPACSNPNDDEGGESGLEAALPMAQIDLLLSAVQAATAPGEPAESPSAPPVHSAGTESSLDAADQVVAPPIAGDSGDELIHDEVILEAYLDDAVRCLGSMEQATLAVEENPENRESLHQFCRELHTLKGASGTVGLANLASYLHQLESSLAATASLGEIPTAVESMLGAVDRVREEIARLRGKSAGTGAATNLPTESPRGGASEPQREFAPVLSGDDALIRIRASKLDRLMDMLAELVVLRNRRESHVAEFNEFNEELSRCSSRLAFVEEHPHWEEGDEGNGGSISVLRSGSKTISEIARDLTVVSRGLRDLQKPLQQDNLSISHFIRDFRQELMQLRRVPLTGLFQRLQRAARDAARRENKQVQVKVLGEDAGIEQELQERLFEPLLHIVRNAVSHGIENEPQRRRHGKTGVGTITLEAQTSPQLLVIQVSDDGQGLNYDAIRRRAHEKGLLTSSYQASTEELSRLIFQPGFSTREQASEVSGRGVGMDVVANTLDQLRGRIDIDSVPGRGTTMRLSVPLRSGIEHVMVFRAAGQLFALPTQTVAAARSGQATRDKVKHCALTRLLALSQHEHATDGEVLLLRQANRGFASNQGKRPDAGLESLGLIVDEIVGPEEVVVRGLPALLKRHPLFCGLTLSGAGETVLLLDSNRLVEFHQRFHSDPSETSREDTPRSGKGVQRVLVVDDSLSARKMLVKKLTQLGFITCEAGDGFEGLEKLRQYKFDLVLTDLDMPRLGGIEMLFDMQRGHYGDAPVVVVTSRQDEEIRSRALENGAVEYLTKPVTDAMLQRMLSKLNLLHLQS